MATDYCRFRNKRPTLGSSWRADSRCSSSSIRARRPGKYTSHRLLCADARPFADRSRVFTNVYQGTDMQWELMDSVKIAGSSAFVGSVVGPIISGLFGRNKDKGEQKREQFASGLAAVEALEDFVRACVRMIRNRPNHCHGRQVVAVCPSGAAERGGRAFGRKWGRGR